MPDAPQLDQLASTARTTLVDMAAGLTATRYRLTNASKSAAAESVSFAVGRLDDIINALNPAEWTRETAAFTLRTLGRHMAEVMDGLRDLDPNPSVRESASDSIDQALDAIDSAIRTLEGEDE